VTKKLEPQTILIGSLVLLGLAICAIGWFALVAPERSKVGGLSGQITVAQTELTIAEGAKSRPGTSPFRASDLFRLAKAMPSAYDMPGIVIELRNLAAQSTVELTGVRPGTVVPLTLGYSALPLAVTVTGRYTAVSRFMGLLSKGVQQVGGARLQVGGRLFDADSIQLQAGTPTDSLSATLSLVAFVYTGNILPAPGATTTGQSAGSTTTTTTTTTSATPPAGGHG
jgi:Tfp pilus assembly protein PilO